MLPDIPTLLIAPNKELQQRLLNLVSLISTSKSEVPIRGAFIQRYLLCQRSKITKGSVRKKNPPKQKSGVNKTRDQVIESKQEIYLNNIIANNISWASVEKDLGLFQDSRKISWHYFHYLIIEVLRRTPKYLGHYMFICFWDKSWQIASSNMDLVKKSSYIRNKIDELLSQGMASLQKIQDNFLKKLMICIFQREGTPQILEVTNFVTLVKQKKDNINFMIQEWLSFLSGSFTSNTAKQAPILKYIKQKGQLRFVLRWSKIRVLPATVKSSFQLKLDGIRQNVDKIQESFINEIEQELLAGLMIGRSWSEVKSRINSGVQFMNSFEIKNEHKERNYDRLFFDESLQQSIHKNKKNSSLNMTWDKITQQSFRTQRTKERQRMPIKLESQKAKDLSYSFEKIAKIDDIEYPDLLFTEEQQEMLFHVGRHQRELTLFKKKYFKDIRPEVVEQFYANNFEYLENKYKKVNQFYETPEILSKIKNEDLIKLRNATKCLQSSKPLFIREVQAQEEDKKKINDKEKGGSISLQCEVQNKRKREDEMKKLQFGYNSQTLQSHKGRLAN